MKLILERSYSFYVCFSLDLSISIALPTAKYLPTPILSTTEILIVKPTLEVSGRLLKCFPQVRYPHLGHTVMVIGVAREEPSAVTGSMTSTTMSCQVQVSSFCLEKSLLFLPCILEPP